MPPPDAESPAPSSRRKILDEAVWALTTSAMNEAGILKEIELQFGKEIKALGKEAKIVFVQELPPEPGFVRKFWGCVRGATVWLYKGFLGGVFILTLFVLSVEVPDSVPKFKIYYPQTYEMAVDLEQKVESMAVYPLIDSQQHRPSEPAFVAIKPEWLADKRAYDQDIIAPSQFTSYSNGTNLIPISGVLGQDPSRYVFSIATSGSGIRI